MKILRWWIDPVDMLPGVSIKLFPDQEATEGQAFFDECVAAVRASNHKYELIERTDVVLDDRR